MSTLGLSCLFFQKYICMYTCIHIYRLRVRIYVCIYTYTHTHAHTEIHKIDQPHLNISRCLQNTCACGCHMKCTNHEPTNLRSHCWQECDLQELPNLWKSRPTRPLFRYLLIWHIKGNLRQLDWDEVLPWWTPNCYLLFVWEWLTHSQQHEH